jgi:signal transduction histidine kinase
LVPVVVAWSVLFAVSAPAAYHVQKRRELVAEARTAAKRLAALVAETAVQRPRLWRYDGQKVKTRASLEGMDGLAAWVVRDPHGVVAKVEPAQQGRGGRLLWGKAPVELGGRHIADVWVGADGSALVGTTARLAVLFTLLALLLGVASYWIPVRVLRRAEARVHELVAQLARTLTEEERRRIARELHDGAGQALTAAKLHLVALRTRTEDESALLASRHVDEALEEIRRSTVALLPAALETMGLAGALESHCAAFGRAAGLRVTCVVTPRAGGADEDVALAAYRVVQEGLHNVARHGEAGEAWVRVEQDGGWLVVEVADNGKGIPAGSRPLSSVEERVRMVDGTLEVLARQGGGTRVVARLPCGLDRGA